MNIKLSVDTLGSETLLSDIILGLSESSTRFSDYFFYLFGNKNLIKKELNNILCHGTGGVLSSAATTILSKEKK